MLPGIAAVADAVTFQLRISVDIRLSIEVVTTIASQLS